jgi:hypothetical protein
MTNPMDALVSLQGALDAGTVRMRACEIHSDVKVLVDYPDGDPRITYAKVTAGLVQSIAIFVMAEPIQNVACFGLGCASLNPCAVGA